MGRTALILCLILSLRHFKAQELNQDTIFLMNGHVVAEKVIDTTLGIVSIYNPEKHGKMIHYEWNQLYMVRFANGYRRFYYEQDTTQNNWFTRDEMWMFMKGERDARKGFRGNGSLIGGGVAGLIGGLTGTIWAPLAPFAFLSLTGAPKVRIRHETISNPAYIESDAYILGYERVARQKRKVKAVIGGAVGLVAGFAGYAIFGKYYPEKIDFGR